MPTQGIETAEFGAWLTRHLADSPAGQGHRVFYDHGDRVGDPQHVCAIKAYFGEGLSSNLNRLADVDVLIEGPGGEACFLIEIEERGVSPKKLLGDAMALILANRLRAGNNRSLSGRDVRLTPETRMIIAGVLPEGGHRLGKLEQTIQPRLAQLKGLPGGLEPAKIELLFATSTKKAMDRLRQRICQEYP